MQVIAVNNNGSDLSVFLGNGDGTFQDEITPRPSVTDSIFSFGSKVLAFGLFDGDEHIDLVSNNDSGIGSVALVTGNGDGWPETATGRLCDLPETPTQI